MTQPNFHFINVFIDMALYFIIIIGRVSCLL